MYLLLVTDYISNRQFIFDNIPINVTQDNYKTIFHEYVNKIQDLHKGFDMYMNIINNECEIYYFKQHSASSSIRPGPHYKQVVYLLHFIPVLSTHLDYRSQNTIDKSTNTDPNSGNYPNSGNKEITEEIKKEFIVELEDRLNMQNYGLGLNTSWS